ncbi:MAG: two-component system LytT family response regulator [Psychroserpens sp.]|jgi:two-component system LytT family response regulator
MNKYTAIILDDEEKGRNGLEKLVGEYCPQIDLISTAASGEDAYAIICKFRPRILFLDIEIAQSSSEFTTSFELLSKLPKYHYEVVFVTAFEHYALQALRSHAIGYVLKPVAIEDLISGVDDAIQNLSGPQNQSRTTEMVDQLNDSSSYSNRLWIHSQKDIVPINTAEIIRLEAQGKYTDIFVSDGTKVTSSKNLGEFSEMLDENVFIKVHRSHIINTQRVSKFSKADGGYVVTSDNITIPVSKNGKERLLKKLT